MRSRLPVVMILGAAAVIAALVLVLVGVVSSTPSVADRNRAEAMRVAERMLNALTLPAGAQQISSAPHTGGNFLDGPFTRYLVASQVDSSRFWTVRDSPQEAVAVVAAGLPATARAGYSTSGGSELQTDWRLATVDPRSLGARQLALSAVRVAPGDTVIRADAEIRYVAPHSPGQRIPPAAHALDITVGTNLSRPLASLTVTRSAEVTAIARIANALPFAGNQQGVSYSCPLESGTEPVDRLTFRRSPTGPVLATITEAADTLVQDDPCSSTALTVRGHREPDLQDGGLLLQRAGRLLHVRLSR